MRFSHLFTRTTRDSSREEVSRNAQLLTRAGYVNRLSAGVYSYLPLGLRVLNNIEKIVREEMNAIGGQEVLLPSLHPRANWEATGRWESLDVLYKMTSSRNTNGGEADTALGATHEEVVTPLLGGFIHSWRDMPRSVYQIQTKFRNEPRPKSGLLRGREFRMKDMYSFHADISDLDAYYEKATTAYRNVYERCGLGDRTVLTYASGGSFAKYSHEFQTITPYGEDVIYRMPGADIAINKEIAQNHQVLADVIPNYKPGDEKQLEEVKAIEVGNIFKLGTKFSNSFGIKYNDNDGKSRDIIMGCYGIGTSRLLGAIAECLSDDNGLIWPVAIAPFKIGVINLKIGHAASDNAVAEILQAIAAWGGEAIYDDRDTSAGVKFADMELLGIPYQVIIGPRGLEKGLIEIKERASGAKHELSIAESLNLLRNKATV